MATKHPPCSKHRGHAGSPQISHAGSPQIGHEGSPQIRHAHLQNKSIVTYPLCSHRSLCTIQPDGSLPPSQDNSEDDPPSDDEVENESSSSS